MAERIPTKDNCDQSDPEQKFQWIATHLPFAGMQGYTPQPDQRAAWSKLWSDLGMEHCDNLRKLADGNGLIHVDQLPAQKLKLAVPHRGQQHYLNGAMAWIGIDEPEVEPVMLPDMAEYTRHEQEVVAEDLRYHGVIKDREPKLASSGYVDDANLFNPLEHTVNGVNCYLMAPIPMSEKRRVMGLEMNSKKPRQGILNHPNNRGI